MWSPCRPFSPLFEIRQWFSLLREKWEPLNSARGPGAVWLFGGSGPLQPRRLSACSPWARPAPASGSSRLLIPVRGLLCTQLSLRLPFPLPVGLWPDVIFSTFRVETPTCKSILVFFRYFSSPEHLSIVEVLYIFIFYMIYCFFFPSIYWRNFISFVHCSLLRNRYWLVIE